MSEQKLILGKTEKEIRSAYFKKKIPQLLTEISADGTPDNEGLVELAKFLESLKAEEGTTIGIININAPNVTVFKDEKEVQVPTFDVDTPEERAEREKFFVEADKANTIARRLMFGVHQMGQNRSNITREQWLDYGLELASILHLIDAYRVFKDQAYRLELTRLISEMRCSRKEAEEWAKGTNAYAEYKRAILFKAQIEEFIMLCKKKAGINDFN